MKNTENKLISSYKLFGGFYCFALIQYLFASLYVLSSLRFILLALTIKATIWNRSIGDPLDLGITHNHKNNFEKA